MIHWPNGWSSSRWKIWTIVGAYYYTGVDNSQLLIGFCPVSNFVMVILCAVKRLWNANKPVRTANESIQHVEERVDTQMVAEMVRFGSHKCI